MVVDQRHDHSFRVPRPDLSAKLGTPNACNDCHTDKSPEWAAIAIESWHGPDQLDSRSMPKRFTQRGRSNQMQRRCSLPWLRIPMLPRSPAPVRLSELAPHVSPANVNLAKSGLSDPDPMVRIGALDMLEGVPPSQIWPLVSPLLADSSRGVRIKAADLLAAVPAASQPPADREKFELAAAEFVAAQRLNADRPESRSALGNFYARRG